MNLSEDSHIERDEAAVDVSASDRARISLRGTAISVLGLLALMLLSLAAPYALQCWLKSGETEQGLTAEPARDTSFRNVTVPLSTEQRVQREMYEDAERKLLDSYEWTDQKAGIARIPISRAMQLIEQREQQREKP